MMFGHKYVNWVLEFLGADRADEQRMGDLLARLEQVENALKFKNTLYILFPST